MSAETLTAPVASESPLPLRIRPREARFGEGFSSLAGHLVSGAHVVAEALGADQAARLELAHQMREVDQQAEEAAHGILRELAAAFVTPIDRVDVFRLAWGMRLCSRQTDAVVDQVALFGMGVLPGGVTDQVVLIGRAADLTLEAMPRLGRVRAMSQVWIEMMRLVKQSGEVHRQLIASLLVPTTDDVALERLLRVADGVAAAMAAYEHVGDVLEQIVVKEG